MAVPRLAFMRSRQARFMPDKCTRVRAGVPDLQTICSVVRESTTVLPVPTDRLQPQPRWIISLPYGTDVQRGDTLQAMGQRYSVVEEEGPVSLALLTQVICLRLGAITAGGDDLTAFLHPNVMVQIRRHLHAPDAKQTRAQDPGPSFPARVDDVSNTLTEQGMGPVFMLKLACGADVDIQDGDIVSSITPPVATMPTLAQVQHVATERVNSGLVYKTALIVEQIQAGGG